VLTGIRPRFGLPLTVTRYAGLAGSIALAAGAYQVGALPGRAAGDSLPGLGQMPGLVAAAVGLVALTAAWWRIGPYVEDGRWMVVTAALWTFPLLLAPPLASRDVYAYACQGAVYDAGLDPHTVGPAALPCPWLASVPPLWQDAPSPYGPLVTLVAAAATHVSTGRIAVVVALLRVVAVVGVLVAGWYGRRIVRACGVDPALAAWLGLAAPLVAVHAVSGAHVDAWIAGLLLAAFAAALRDRGTAFARDRGAFAAALRERGAATGALLGLAVAVKATAVVALPFLALLVFAHRGTPGRRAGRVAITVLTAGLTYAALAVASGLGLGFVRGLGGTADLVQWTSAPTAVGMTVGYALRWLGLESGMDTAVAVARVLGLAAAAAVVVLAWWRAARAPEPRTTVAAAGVALGAVALLGPVFYPWYALAPLALLAVSTSDDRIRAWLGVGAGTLGFLILPNGVGLAPRTKLLGALVVTAAVGALVARAARRAVPTRPTTRGS
jgi:alpha-1,6-mannosyltransferase